MREKINHGLFKTLAILFLSMVIGPAASLALDVKGILEEDATWTVADSPVNIIADVLVAQEVTLTIEPGVKVVFQALDNASPGFLFNVEGTLVARGTATLPIHFTAQDRELPWDSIVFRDVSQDWDGTTSTGCILSYCIVEYGDSMIVTENAMPRIANNAIRYGSSVGIAAYAIEGAVSTSGRITIIENQIYNNPTGILLSEEGGPVLGNYFLNNDIAVSIVARSNAVDFQNNTVVTSSGDLTRAGVYVEVEGQDTEGEGPDPEAESAEIVIENNAIQSDNAGASLVAITAGEEARFDLRLTGNNLFFTDEERYAVYLFDWPNGASAFTLVLPDNWWGTVDTETIDGLIYDQNDDYRLPTIDYEPFAKQAFVEAGSQLGYPAVADAGPDSETAVDNTVTLDGSNSYDPDEIGVYNWQQVEGPSVKIHNADLPVASFIAPRGGTEGQELQFRLTVSTGTGFPDTDGVLVTVSPDEQVPLVEVGGGCFLQSAVSIVGVKTMKEATLIAGILGVFFGLIARIRTKKQIVLISLLLLSVCFVQPAEAGFVAVGAGGGGDAGQYNITLETGAKDIALFGQNMMFAFGIPFIPHGDKNIPENTIALPCPNESCQAVGDERKGSEVGFFGKLGLEIGSTRLFVNAIGGFTVYTESQLVQPEGSDSIYEQSSDTTLAPLYGAGLSYFPENWPWPILLELDYDVTRGVTGSIGWYW